METPLQTRCNGMNIHLHSTLPPYARLQPSFAVLRRRLISHGIGELGRELRARKVEVWTISWDLRLRGLSSSTHRLAGLVEVTHHTALLRLGLVVPLFNVRPDELARIPLDGQ